MAQPGPRVGLSIFPGCSDLSDLPARLDEAEGFGVDTIELPIYDYDVVVGGRIRAEQLARVKAACRGRSAGFTAHGPLGINFFDPPWRCSRHWNVLAASLEAAAALDCEHYVLHSGTMGIVQHDGIEDAYERQREWLVRAGDLARSMGVVVCVENLFAGYEGVRYTATPARLARELATIDHPFVQATLDFGHGHLNLAFQGGDLVEECGQLAPRSRHLHVHDNFGRQDDIWTYTHGEKIAFGHGDLHLPVGWGDIPWDVLMSGCVFPPGVIFNIELEERHWHEAGACIAATRALAARARIATG
ncbi:sugar phosphate isomerase/epimerase [uncultured Alsobacter sp.]|uniref:sugar phosphate isomerase/epimerase family protein n=1 Tax=uncultured Alsobacter sp. TaxID=1748258 RepID=UPI0025DC4D2D|nr:sugar phosphate isomerase/epimerase [uncultured Alsobacter sp.]